MTSGELKRLIDEDGLRGMTSNPAIFEKAIADSKDYADFLKSLPREISTPRRAMKLLPFAIFRMRPIFCAPCTTAPGGTTGT